MHIMKLQDSKNNIFWKKLLNGTIIGGGLETGESLEAVRCNLEHSLNAERLPQTFVALLDGEPAGMYQLSMCENLNSRPDIYPWLINVYVDEKFRNQNVCRQLMNTVKGNAQKGKSERALFIYKAYWFI